jgi:hypothetical protein
VREEGQLPPAPSRSRWAEDVDDKPKAARASKERSNTNGHAASPGEVSRKHKLLIVMSTTRVWHGATEIGETTPTLSRCTCSPRYGLQNTGE